MFLIQQVTNAPYQRQTVVLDSGISISLTLYFRSMQQGWFISGLAYLDFTLEGIRITNNPNMPNQWRNLLPFGLACFSVDNREPSLIEDFASGASKLFVLTADEVAEYTRFLRGL